MQFMDRQWHDMYRQWIYSWDECLYSFPRKSRPSEWIRCRLIWTKKRRQNLEIASIAVSRHCRHQKYCDWQWIVVRVVFRDISLRCIRKSIDRLELIGKWVLWPIRFFVETFDFQKKHKSCLPLCQTETRTPPLPRPVMEASNVQSIRQNICTRAPAYTRLHTVYLCTFRFYLWRVGGGVYNIFVGRYICIKWRPK